MRLDRLDLIRYGRFTDRVIGLPVAERDFHVIVGPNEAGKSTLRAAIQDLLFGIPTRTPHAFLHPMPELRLGASLSQAGQTLPLQRVKGNRQTLRDAADKPLADAVLAPYLGGADREFFAQMFGLDHERLVKGGHSILSASNDLGQVLFQSAAGIGSLGAVRKALEDEADTLWAKRRSGDRAYYQAADALEQATTALKQATVRSKDWADAQAGVLALDGSLAEVRRQHAEVKTRRSLLERVRRVLPHLQALDQLGEQLATLAAVAELPDNAAKTLAEAERAIGLAQVVINHQSEQLAQARLACAGLTVDDAVRAAEAEITELDAQRLQYRAHAADIGRRQAEIDQEWARVCGLAGPLGWDCGSEAAVRARLPSAAACSALDQLLRVYPALAQTLAAAERAEQAKRTELAQAAAALAGLPQAAASPVLEAALARAQALGDVAAQQHERRRVLQQREASLDTSLAALGRWQLPPAALRTMVVPAADTLAAFSQAQAQDAAQARSLASRMATLAQEADKARLELTQYRRAHAPVTWDEVAAARQQRSAHWAAIQADAQGLAQHGAAFEQALRVADTLADRRHDTAQQAGELLGRQAQLERIEQELAQQQQALAALQDQGTARDRQWAALAAGCGLPALPFASAAQWLAARSAALAADAALTEARLALQSIDQADDHARQALATALRAVLDPQQLLADVAPLAALVLVAGQQLKDAAAVRGTRQTLDKQHADAARSLGLLVDDSAQARQALAGWSLQWARGLADAGLPADADRTGVSGLLDTMGQIRTALATINQTRVERIHTMQADLAQHAQAARALALRLAPEPTAEPASEPTSGQADLPADQIALGLLQRLGAANTAHQEQQRQQALLRAAQQRLDEADLQQQQARAALQPLLQRAGVTTAEDLAAAVAASDRRRGLQREQAAAERAICDGGDGLTLDHLRAEAACMDPQAVVGELSELTDQDNRLVDRLAHLSAEHQAASSRLAAIAGTADAARAEALRQEALASMGAVVERYLKVFTAARLLKWSIERYREARQGPMLQAASRIFASLTLGSFERLTVDFDHEPLALMGRRSNGDVVEIAGMSEGTRDQLFLALRLAALDMHLDQAQALPFIADDLFINYDDARSQAGLAALGELSRKTQVLFLTHHEHLLPAVQQVFGPGVNIVHV